MNDDDTLPQLPAPSPPPVRQPSPGRKALKPESPWATRIRRLLALKSARADYLPYMPVRKPAALARLLGKAAAPEPADQDQRDTPAIPTDPLPLDPASLQRPRTSRRSFKVPGKWTACW